MVRIGIELYVSLGIMEVSLKDKNILNNIAACLTTSRIEERLEDEYPILQRWNEHSWKIFRYMCKNRLVIF